MESLDIAEKDYSWLSWVLRALALGIFLILFGRLFEITIIKGAYYRSLAEENRIKRVPIIAPRGRVLALGGEVLIGNKEISSSSEERIIEWEREYLLGEKFAHVGGYLAEANQDEVGKTDPKCPEKGERLLGSYVGRSGLEQEYDCALRGVDGEEMFEVDTKGKILRSLGRKEGISGSDLKTYINYSLQKKSSEIFASSGFSGAVVATDGQGKILAMYSNPSFDPRKIESAIGNPGLPLFNRAIGGAYHPGSTFKITTALAALVEGKIDESFRYVDTGQIAVNDFTYTNWYFTQYGKVEGELGLDHAIARSTDTFFYKIGELVGPDKLAEYARKFGFGAPTGVDLPGEVGGLVPDPAWKRRYKGERWFLGNTYHFAIGQGDLTATPLQVNLETSIVSASGVLCTPKISGQGDCTKLGIDEKYIDEVKEGMVQACQEGGTGYPFFDFKTEDGGLGACKTGTAQTSEEDKTHAWFTVFAPEDDPKLVLTILAENAGEGSQKAAPLAREIMDYYFNP